MAQGTIFWSDDDGRRRDLRFEEAFPEINAVAVDVIEHGHGNAGLGLRRFQKRSVREFVNCSSERCAGKGFSLGRMLRRMVSMRRERLHVVKSCESREESGSPCGNAFDVAITLQLRHPDPRETTNPAGVLAFLHWDHAWNGHHFPASSIERAARILGEAGIGTVRTDFLWSDVEPHAEQFAWERYENIVDALRRRKIAVLGVLHYNPLWRPGAWNQAPDAPAYLRFIRATVKRFKDRVRYWEIWNEPDHPNYWQPQDGLAAYAALLTKATAAVKEEDPSALTLLGGLSQNIPSHLQTIYERAGKNSFDVVNMHPFANPLNDGALEFVESTYRESLTVMRRFDDGDKPIWLTEIGCPGLRGGNVAPWWLGANPTEEQQAQWLKAVFAHVPSWPNIERVFWAFFRDTPGHFKDGVDYFGLVREDFSLKPAYRALQRASSKLNGDLLS